jgi:hypothetical protein
MNARASRFAVLSLLSLLAVACSTVAPPASSPVSSPSIPARAASSGPPIASPSVPVSNDASAEPSDELDGTAGPGCGTGQKGLFAHRAEVPGVLHFGGATIEFATAHIAMINGTYSADDTIPAGIGLVPKEIAVKVERGTRIRLRGDGMTLTDVDARVVPWSDVTFAGGMAGWSVEPTALKTVVRADGSISVSAPEEPGDYAVQFSPRWHTGCLEGDGSAYSRIKVVELVGP